MTTAVVQQSACQTLTSMKPRARTVHGGGSGTDLVLYARAVRCECDRDTGEKPHVPAPARGRPKPTHCPELACSHPAAQSILHLLGRRLQSMTGREYVVVPRSSVDTPSELRLPGCARVVPGQKNDDRPFSRSTRKAAGLSGTNNDCASCTDVGIHTDGSIGGGAGTGGKRRNTARTPSLHSLLRALK